MSTICSRDACPKPLRPGSARRARPKPSARALSAAAGKLDELTATTIHAFCQTIICSYAVEADIDPGARILDATQAEAAFDAVFEQWFRRRLNGPARADDPIAALSQYDPRHVAATLARARAVSPGASRRAGACRRSERPAGHRSRRGRRGFPPLALGAAGRAQDARSGRTARDAGRSLRRQLRDARLSSTRSGGSLIRRACLACGATRFDLLTPRTQDGVGQGRRQGSRRRAQRGGRPPFCARRSLLPRDPRPCRDRAGRQTCPMSSTRCSPTTPPSSAPPPFSTSTIS